MIVFLGRTCKLWEESIEPVTRAWKTFGEVSYRYIVSRWRRRFDEFIKPLRLGAAAILGNGKQVVSWIHINDLCRLFIKALEDDGLYGSYNAVAPQPVTNKMLTLDLAKKMNGKFFIAVHVPHSF